MIGNIAILPEKNSHSFFYQEQYFIVEVQFSVIQDELQHGRIIIQPVKEDRGFDKVSVGMF